MSQPSGSIPSDGVLLGRTNEIADIEFQLFNEGKRVICVLGEGGVGKTRFANTLFARVTPKYEAGLAVYLPPHGLLQNVEDLALSTLLSRSGGMTPQGLSPDALLNEFLSRMATSPTVCLIDNAESLSERWLRSFVMRWLQLETQSILVLTTRDSPLKAGDKHVLGFRNFIAYRLEGLPARDHRSLLALLGPELAGRFSERQLLEVARKVSCIPQRLLYLRWIAPQSMKQLQELAQQLSAGVLLNSPVERVVARASGGVVPFLSLGRIRALRFDEALLASLWDRLGGGSTKSFVKMRNLLLEQGVLSQSEIDDAVYLNPAVHVQLEKYVSRELAAEQLAQIEYHIANYYKTAVTESEAIDAQSLNEYIYHSARARNLASAVGFVLTRSWLERLRRNGQVLGARRIIDTARLELADQPEVTNHIDPYVRRRDLSGRLALELAHALCDLSDYRGALDALDAAERDTKDWAASDRRAAFVEALHYRRAVCLGDSGRLEDAVATYLGLVYGALKTRRVTQVSLESLGYAAMILSYLQQFSSAVMLGDLSVKLADRLALKHVAARNNCSLAQALLHSGDLPMASERLAQAERSIRRSARLEYDRRNFGRILVVKAALLTALGDLDEASSIVAEAVALNEEIGDRRRVGRAVAVKGSIAARKEDLVSAAWLFTEATQALLDVGDLFDALLARFCMAYVQSELVAAGMKMEVDPGTEVRIPSGHVALLSDYPLHTVSSFWANSYGPQLLGLRPSVTELVRQEFLLSQREWLGSLGYHGGVQH